MDQPSPELKASAGSGPIGDADDAPAARRRDASLRERGGETLILAVAGSMALILGLLCAASLLFIIGLGIGAPTLAWLTALLALGAAAAALRWIIAPDRPAGARAGRSASLLSEGAPLGAESALTAALLLITVLWLAAILLAGSVYDWSWDGQHYHQELVIQLARGWNPVWESFRVADVGLVDGELDLWINHYPRAAGALGAAVYGLTGAIETAKFFNPLLIALTGLYAAALLRRIAGFAWLWAALFGAALALNAVASAQALSFYIDGASFAALALIALAGAHLIWLGPDLKAAEGRAPLLILTAAIILSATLKFTGLVFAVFVLLFVGFAALWRARGRIAEILPLAAASFGAGVLCLLLLGVSPYLQNLVVAGHPFHPVMGADAFDIMTRSTPRAFLELSGPEALFASLFGAPEVGVARYEPRPLPHLVSAQELQILSFVDPRVGGWGPVFPEQFVIALLGALALMLLARARPETWIGVFGLGAAVLLALIHPEAWWARYSAFLLAGPWILFAAAAAIPSLWTRALAGVGLALMLANNAPVAWTATDKAYEVSAKISSGLEEIAEATAARGAPAAISLGLFHSNRVKLREHGVPFTATARADDLPCEEPKGFYNGHWISRICY